MKTIQRITFLATAWIFLSMGNIASGQEAIIYSTGFESSQSFTAGTVYNNSTIKFDGPSQQQWGTFFGTASTTGPISGLQTMQMRWYSTTPSNLGYTFTNFDMPRVTKVEFLASKTSTINVVASYSIDGGNTFIGNQLFTLTTTPTTYTFNISQTGEHQNVRIKFQIAYSTAPSNGSRLLIDEIRVYGISTVNEKPAITNLSQSPSEFVQFNQNVNILAEISDADGSIELAELYWGNAPDELYNTIPLNIQGGNTYAATIPAQPNGTNVFYSLYAEDDGGGSVVSSTRSYEVSPVLLLETFEEGMEGFYTYSVTGDSVWMYNPETKAVEINGTNSGATEEDWLVLPAINLGNNRLVLTFDTWRRLGLMDSKNYLWVYYSTNYPGQGNPAQYSWTKLAYNMPTQEQTWTNSGNVLLPVLPGQTIYVAFKYRYLNRNYAIWSIDNIQLARENYSVTLNVVDGTVPVENAVVEFNGATKNTNAQGQVIFNLVEGNSSYPYSISKVGYHNTEGQVNVALKNVVQTASFRNNQIAVNVGATPGSSSAIITWEGSGAEQYVVYYKDIATNVQKTAGFSASPATIITSPLTTYEVRVRTKINGVFVAYSNAVQLTTTAGTNIIASNINVDEITSSSARVNWESEGADEFIVNYYNAVSGTNFYVYTLTSPVTIPLVAATEYEVRVRTRVGATWLSYSAPVTFSTLAGTNTLADAITVDNITSSSVRVNWSGIGADQYRVYYTDNSTSIQYQLSTTLSPVTIPVTPATEYSIKVRTLLGGVWVGYSQTVTITTPAGEQIMATNLQVDNITSTNARVSWSGQGAEQYRVYFRNMTTLVESVVSTSVSPLIINILPGTTYQVRIRSLISGKWTIYSSAVEFTSPLGFKESTISALPEGSMPANLSIYPNPASNYTTLAISLKENTNISVGLYDVRGALIGTEKLDNMFGEVQHRIDVSHLPKGIYFIKVSSPGFVETLRFIVQ